MYVVMESSHKLIFRQQNLETDTKQTANSLHRWGNHLSESAVARRQLYVTTCDRCLQQQVLLLWSLRHSSISLRRQSKTSCNNKQNSCSIRKLPSYRRENMAKGNRSFCNYINVAKHSDRDLRTVCTNSD